MWLPSSGRGRRPYRSWLTAFVAALSCLIGVPARAEPALWVAQSRTATVYLFGAVHMLRKSVVWETPKIIAAFNHSDELWLEVADPGDAAAATPVLSKLGFDRVTPLSRKLAPADRARLAADARALGEPLSAFEPMRPWLAAVRLSTAPLLRAGFDPEAGVDRLLRRRAVLAGRPVKAFETIEQQIRVLSDQSEAAQMAELHRRLDRFARAAAEQEVLQNAWTRGDTDALSRALDTDLARDGRERDRFAMRARNHVYARVIARRLKGRGTAFVAVGAGHLAGPDGVQALLARHGVIVRRL